MTPEDVGLAAATSLAVPVSDAVCVWLSGSGWPAATFRSELGLDDRAVSIVADLSDPAEQRSGELDTDARTLWLFASAFDGLGGRITPATMYLRATLLHELAHLWDAAHDLELSAAFVAGTGGSWTGATYVPGNLDGLPYATTKAGSRDHYEDFAESVVVTLEPRAHDAGGFGSVDRHRRHAVTRLFAAAGRAPVAADR